VEAAAVSEEEAEVAWRPRGGGGGMPDFANMSPKSARRPSRRCARAAVATARKFSATTPRTATAVPRRSVLELPQFGDGRVFVRPQRGASHQTHLQQLNLWRFARRAASVPSSLAKGSFFFLNYTGARGSNGSAMYGIVPTLAERSGDFSETLLPRTQQPVSLFDPSTKAPFPGGVIPSTQISSIASGLLAFLSAAEPGRCDSKLPSAVHHSAEFRFAEHTVQQDDWQEPVRRHHQLAAPLRH